MITKVTSKAVGCEDGGKSHQPKIARNTVLEAGKSNKQILS